MILRDLTRETASKSKRNDDWELYKKLKNKCNRAVKNDRALHQKQIDDLHVKNRDSAGLYKTAKK